MNGTLRSTTGSIFSCIKTTILFLSRCSPAVAFGSALLPVLCYVALAGITVIYSPSAHALNLQCRWEGGAGAPTYPSCQNEDCIGNGGLAQCEEPIKAPPAPFTSGQAGGEGWMYYSCNEGFGGPPDTAVWCAAAGGSWNGSTCNGLGGAFPGGNPTISNDEGTATSTSLGFATRKNGTCSTSVSSDSGWGATTIPGTCFGNAVGPTYRNGILITDYRLLRYFAGPTCNAQTPTVWLYRFRQLTCPMNYTVRNRPDGGLDCVIPAEACCQKGNPVSLVTGAKMQTEADYQPAIIGGVEFTRYYRSSGAFKMLGTVNTSLSNSDYWRHNYDRRLFPVSGNSTLTGVAQRPDGTLIHFDGAGKELLNRNGAAAILQTVAPGWKITLANSDVETYDSSARLVSIKTRAGLLTTLTYDGSGRLATARDDFGHQLGFAYNADSNLSVLTLPGGGIIQYGYDAAKRLLTVTYADTKVRTYWYENTTWPWALTGITDESNVRYSTYVYDTSSGTVTSEQHAGGAEYYQFYYTQYGTTVTTPSGNASGYALSNQVGVQKVYSFPVDCGDCNHASGVGFDANGNVSFRNDNAGAQTTFAYDLTRNLETSRTEGIKAGSTNARTITTLWHATYRLPTLISVYAGTTATGTPLRTTGFTYDTAGNMLTKTITDPTVVPNTTRTWAYTYNSFGQVLTMDGPRTDVTDVTTFTYYSCTSGTQCGQINTITNALGQITTYNTYNVHGQPLTMTDPNGVVTTTVYDTRQRITSRQVGTETTAYDYWPTGLLKKVTQPDTSYVQYTYDGAHRLTDLTDSLGNYIHYTLDSAGNRTAENAYDPSNALHRTHSRVFNTLNQLNKDVNAAGTAAVTTTFGYDNNFNQTTIAAPLTRNTTNAYDELNRLKQITDSGTGITQFQYDANDNLTQVTDPRSLVTSYQYTGYGEVKQQTSPDTGTSTNTYDSGGNLKTATDSRSAVATYSYDVLNRVTQVAYTDQTITFGYDAGTNGKDRQTSASDASHSMSWTYDAQGRVTGKGQTVGTVTKSVGYGYSNGNLVTMTLPSGQIVTYQYNTNHQITGITLGTGSPTTILSSITYEPFGGVKGWTWGNAATMSRSFDTDGRLTSIASGGVLSLNPIAYDNASRITGITDTITSGNSWTLGYDALDRLSSAAKTGTSYGWTYDANGNRKTQTGTSATTYTIPTTTNRLTNLSGATTRTYGFDASGNVSSYDTNVYTYNKRGRMSAVSVGSTPTSYVYNALGQMVKKAGASTALMMYDEAGHLVGEYTSTGALTQETIWLGDTPVVTIRPNGANVDIFYVHVDQLNTPRLVSRPSDNKLRWRWDFTNPFGGGAATENPASLGTFVYNLRLPGQFLMSETGNRQNGFRDYESFTGRYMQSDPIGLGGGIGTYSYVGNSPVTTVDPQGLAPGKSNLPPSFYLKECDGPDWKECEGRCSPNRVLTCKRRYDRKLGAANGGNLIWDYKKGNLQCNCEDKFCDRNPKTCVAGVGAVVVGAIVLICVAPEMAPLFSPAF